MSPAAAADNVKTYNGLDSDNSSAHIRAYSQQILLLGHEEKALFAIGPNSVMVSVDESVYRLTSSIDRELVFELFGPFLFLPERV
jgi:hypothetical protein